MEDVTSLNRPDTSWLFVDAQGHEHQWYTAADGKPAGFSITTRRRSCG
jgi:hypothetical protein